MKKELYICHTYYHLLISIIKCLHSENESSVVIASANKNQSLFNNPNLIERIKESKIFHEVLIFNHSDKEMKIDNNKIKKYFYTVNCAKKDELDLKKYDEIYIYSETNLIGRMLSIKKINYNLIEDGTDCYKRNSYIINKKWTLKRFIKRMFKFYGFGESKYIKSIEVNDATGIENIHQNLIVVPKKELFDTLKDEDKEKIIKIFLPQGIEKEKFEDADMIITQPLSEDTILKSEESKIKLYKQIIDNYLRPSTNVIIKTHPRENTDYSNYFKDCTIIDFPFPIELIDFLPVKLNKIITVSSTSIELINNCKEKKYLGWEYLDEFKRCGDNNG